MSNLISLNYGNPNRWVLATHINAPYNVLFKEDIFSDSTLKNIFQYIFSLDGGFDISPREVSIYRGKDLICDTLRDKTITPQGKCRILNTFTTKMIAREIYY